MHYSILPPLLTLSLISAPSFAQFAEKKTTADDQVKMMVTIYNNNLALIKDQRNITLKKGKNHLAFKEVSAKMRPETAMLRSLTHSKGFSVLEQNFDYDLLTPNKLLDKYVGKQVSIAKINPATGKQTIEKATVLSTHEGVVLKIGDRIETNPAGQYIFDNIPSNLRDQPTLVTQLNSATAQAQQLELSYLSGGLSWKADYIAELNASSNAIDLQGWVTLNNTSGATYNHAKLQLVAGDVNRVQPVMRMRNRAMKSYAMAEDAGSMAEESLLEYHLYSLNHLTNILNNQSKQVALLSAFSVPVNKELVLNGSNYYYRSQQGLLGQKLKVEVYIQLHNKKSAGLGMPLPKGIVRVYKNDSQGNAQFVGEDSIDHTPKNEVIRLKLGNSFDVTAHKNQTDFKTHGSTSLGNYSIETAYQIELKNAKSKAVTVIVREPIPSDWKMLKENHPHKKVATGTAEWTMTIPAEQSVTLSYRVRINY